MHEMTCLRLSLKHLHHVERSCEAIRRKIGPWAEKLGIQEGVELAEEAVQFVKNSGGRFRTMGD